jgi:hypothetical protein
MLVPVSGAGERIEIAGEQVPGPSDVTAVVRGEPPPGRGDLDGQIDEQRAGAADHLGTDAACR